MPVFSRGSHYAINILAAEQIELARRFAMRDVDRFAGASWREGAGGAPVPLSLDSSGLRKAMRGAEGRARTGKPMPASMGQPTSRRLSFPNMAFLLALTAAFFRPGSPSRQVEDAGC